MHSFIGAASPRPPDSESPFVARRPGGVSRACVFAGRSLETFVLGRTGRIACVSRFTVGSRRPVRSIVGMFRCNRARFSGVGPMLP